MNVIRHDTPGKQSVFLIVEVIQGISHDIGDLWPAKMAGTRSIVKILLDDASRELLDFLCLVRAQISLKLDRRLDNAFAFGADSVEDRLGQRVGQPESYKVGRAFLFPVRQVPPVADLHITEAWAGRPRHSRRDAGGTVGNIGIKIRVGYLSFMFGRGDRRWMRRGRRRLWRGGRRRALGPGLRSRLQIV